jgi:DNA-binding NarL/FixJ family response regulator
MAMIEELVIIDAMESVQIPQLIKVAIVEDRREIRDGLAMLIGGTEGFKCTGSYRSMEDTLARIGADLPDVVLCDIGLPGMSGIEGMRILKERFPDLLLLMLTVYDDDERIFDALCAARAVIFSRRLRPLNCSKVCEMPSRAVRPCRRKLRGE